MIINQKVKYFPINAKKDNLSCIKKVKHQEIISSINGSNKVSKTLSDNFSIFENYSLPLGLDNCE